MQLFLNKKMGSNIRKAAVLTAAVASLSFASASWAGQVTFNTFNSVGGVGATIHNGAVTLGTTASEFKFGVSASDYSNWTVGSDFYAFCVDVNHTLVNPPITYNVSSLAAGSTSFGVNFSALQVAQVNKLLDLFQASSSTQKNAAMQMALWEILNESKNQKDVSKGNFYLTSSSTAFNTAVNTANSFLNGLNGLSSTYRSTSYDIVVLSPFNPVTNQGLIGWCNKGQCNDPSVPPQEVSEPGTLLLLSAGLGMIFFSTRRSGAQFASLA